MKFKKSIVITTILLLFVMWLIFFIFLIRYSKDVRTNPLALGAKGAEVDCVCTHEKLPGAFMFISKEGNITYSYPERQRNIPIKNLSELLNAIKADIPD